MERERFKSTRKRHASLHEINVQLSVVSLTATNRQERRPRSVSDATAQNRDTLFGLQFTPPTKISKRMQQFASIAVSSILRYPSTKPDAEAEIVESTSYDGNT